MISNGVDVAIIGSGPAGLAAAISAKEAGAENVTILERAEQPGGLLHQCIHNGFGLTYFNEDLTGPEYARRLIGKATDLRVNIELESMVIDLSPDKELVCSSKYGVRKLRPRAIVLAMGCRERTRQQILIPGFNPSGIMTAGTAQRYVNCEGYIPGKEVVILGSGDVGMIMARRLTLEGVQVKAVVEILPYVEGLIRNEVQCLGDFNIPVYLSHTVTNIHGQQRVEGVTISKVNKNFEPIEGTGFRIDCDLLLTSVGLIPENELSLKAGVRLDPVTGGPIVNENMETNVSGIFAGGNVVHVNDLVDSVSLESEISGTRAAEYALGKTLPSLRRINLKAGENIRYVVPQSIDTGKDVTVYMRVKEPAEKVRLGVGDIYSENLRVVKPSEMLKVKITLKELREIKGGVSEIEISCVKRSK
jgi:NADPH-dependent 2,4-dienoyl-CoA reductase/sulfur reductase-like enzyme